MFAGEPRIDQEPVVITTIYATVTSVLPLTDSDLVRQPGLGVPGTAGPTTEPGPRNDVRADVLHFNRQAGTRLR